ncbi:hypothetical protein SUGI_0285460 [Cryptomeria japonica]|uniref:E3 ubiquitin-protein ligase RING1-like n=1 Tax=Cryptomeria japonica TaxID=3369 RepID=UPI002408EB55|nr:E3 ubiquitin-protein ligase RING1-like [Cryptomeria japonica]GLJ16631.1 hypothetical protein SUGI_0285460 [Cryptomeria japonica]
MQMQEEKQMGCREKEVAEWCTSLESRMGDLRIEATNLFMQANCFMNRQDLPHCLQHLNSRHDSLYSEFLQIEVHEDRLPTDIRCLRGIFNTFDSLRKKIVKIMENERKAKELVEGLPIVTISNFHVEDGLFCGVCRDDFILGEEVREIPCMIRHIFHSHCIWPWLEDHNTCPICTTPFFMEN